MSMSTLLYDLIGNPGAESPGTTTPGDSGTPRSPRALAAVSARGLKNGHALPSEGCEKCVERLKKNTDAFHDFVGGLVRSTFREHRDVSPHAHSDVHNHKNCTCGTSRPFSALSGPIRSCLSQQRTRQQPRPRTALWTPHCFCSVFTLCVPVSVAYRQCPTLCRRTWRTENSTSTAGEARDLGHIDKLVGKRHIVASKHCHQLVHHLRHRVGESRDTRNDVSNLLHGAPQNPHLRPLLIKSQRPGSMHVPIVVHPEVLTPRLPPWGGVVWPVALTGPCHHRSPWS